MLAITGLPDSTFQCPQCSLHCGLCAAVRQAESCGLMCSWQHLVQSIHMLHGAEHVNSQGTETTTKASSVRLGLLAGVAADC